MAKLLFLCWVLIMVSAMVGIATNDLEWGLVGIAGIGTMLFILFIIGGKSGN